MDPTATTWFNHARLYSKIAMKKAALFIIIVIATLAIIFLGRLKSNNKDNQSPSSQENIPSIIIPHFDLAKDSRQAFLNDLKTKISPQKIVIVSPNHQDLGPTDIIAGDQQWDFTDQKPKINHDLYSKLIESKVVSGEPTVFLNEHGIRNVFPEIVEAFPQAEFLPVIIKTKTSQKEIDSLYTQLNTDCPDCLVVASVDFSHYNPNSLAQIHDSFSLKVLTNLNESEILQAEVDCPQALYLAMKWAESRNANKFNLMANDNSGNIAKNDDLESTSYVIGDYSTGEKAKITTTSFVIAGDAMFDRNVYHNYKDTGLTHLFDNLGNRVFWGTDLKLINLEGPISAKAIDDDWQSGSMVFNFPPQTPDVLKYLKLNAVSLANNHTLNNGQAGLDNTKKVLSNAGITGIGSQEGFSEDNLLKLDSEIPISYIAIDELSAQNEGQIDDMIKREKSAGRFVILMPHWGTEYEVKHNSSQSSLAHGWIEAGADLIIGSHPHVTQDFEIYKGKPIIYSLGNFIFDQYFSKETQEGLIVGGMITDKSLKLTFLPFKSVLSKPQLMTGSEKTNKIKTILDLDNPSGFTKVNSDTIEISR